VGFCHNRSYSGIEEARARGVMANRLAGTAPDFCLLAHSHGVALLDGITDWRGAFSNNFPRDPRYGQAFQGWFQGAIPRMPFYASVVRATPSLTRIAAWVMPVGGGIGPLVRAARQGPNAPLEIQVNSAYQEVLQTWKGVTPIVSMINGNEHASMMLNQWPPYDFMDEEVAFIESGVPIIDDTFIDNHVEPWVAEVFFPLAALRHFAPNPLLHVLPPPPRENPQNSPHFEVLQESISKYGFASNQIRLKWYKRYCRRLVTRLSTIQCDVLFPSSQACNPEGLLSEDYAEGLTHGNHRYGMLIAQQIESWLHQLRA
jgi:hypothetical protein